MQVPLQISFHDVDHSDAVETRIREKVAKLEKHFSDLVSCRVVVEAPHKHHHQGRQFSVTVDVSLPGHELVVHSDKGNPAHEDVYIAVRDAFEAVHNQLRHRVEKQRSIDKREREAAD